MVAFFGKSKPRLNHGYLDTLGAEEEVFGSMSFKKTLQLIIYETYRNMRKHAKPHRKPKQEVTTVGSMDDKKQGYEKEHHSLLTRSEIN